MRLSRTYHPNRSIPPSRWKLCQAIISHFWRRWSQEYLQQLQKLHKWRQPTNNLQVGDIVVIRDDAAFHNQWPMARILEVFRGKDGLVSVATLKTATTTSKRPIAKLALLLRDDQPISTTEPSPPTPSTSQKSCTSSSSPPPPPSQDVQARTILH